uniref:Uncharacterized protein n=1 Tax=Kalanchoe fedtschenkoi TaxID=63787 RepID=A0A7N0VIQ1_KALFE
MDCLFNTMAREGSGPISFIIIRWVTALKYFIAHFRMSSCKCIVLPILVPRATAYCLVTNFNVVTDAVLNAHNTLKKRHSYLHHAVKLSIWV